MARRWAPLEIPKGRIGHINISEEANGQPEDEDVGALMTVSLVCPVTGEPLFRDGNYLVNATHTREFPIVDGIPILLPNEQECIRVAKTNWLTEKTDASPLVFYNRPHDHTNYCREELQVEREDIIGLLSRLRNPHEPVLEIGSGRGALQGVSDNYVAFDYSLTALHAYISKSHQRVCGTAEYLPFPDATFGFIYSVATLEHVPAADRAFEEIHRVLRPGGAVFLAPAWNCIQDNCEGIPVRPYSELTLRQKFRKLTLPLRRSLVWKAAIALPMRACRRVFWGIAGRNATRFRFCRLCPEYSKFWMSDSDAVSRLDPHEAALFLHSRGYSVMRPGISWVRQLLAGHAPLVAFKPPVNKIYRSVH